jgi:hypothetical protein
MPLVAEFTDMVTLFELPGAAEQRLARRESARRNTNREVGQRRPHQGPRVGGGGRPSWSRRPVGSLFNADNEIKIRISVSSNRPDTRTTYGAVAFRALKSSLAA